jgi:hypothetical protein
MSAAISDPLADFYGLMPELNSPKILGLNECSKKKHQNLLSIFRIEAMYLEISGLNEFP